MNRPLKKFGADASAGVPVTSGFDLASILGTGNITSSLTSSLTSQLPSATTIVETYLEAIVAFWVVGGITLYLVNHASKR